MHDRYSIVSMTPITRPILGHSHMLRGLLPEDLEPLERTLRQRTYQRGEALFHEGDPADVLHVILAGTVKILVTGEHGKEAILAVLGPGDVLGEMGLLDRQPRSATAVALECVETAILSSDDFLGLLVSRPAVVTGMFCTLASRIRQLNAQVGGLMFHKLHGRVAAKLVELADAHGRQGPEGHAIEIPLTHDDLASMVGATRPRVSEVLSDMESRGLISRRSGRLVVRERELLRHWDAA